MNHGLFESKISYHMLILGNITEEILKAHFLHVELKKKRDSAQCSSHSPTFHLNYRKGTGLPATFEEAEIHRCDTLERLRSKTPNCRAGTRKCCRGCRAQPCCLACSVSEAGVSAKRLEHFLPVFNELCRGGLSSLS